MAETFSKKEKQKKKLQKRKDKEQRKAERKANAKAGQSLEDMMAYVDENGNISSTPPDHIKKHQIKVDDIVTGSRNIGGSALTRHTGKVTYFNASKNYGFIKDEMDGEKIFFHSSEVNFDVNENDRVSFQVSRGPKGMVATNVSR